MDAWIKLCSWGNARKLVIRGTMAPTSQCGVGMRRYSSCVIKYSEKHWNAFVFRVSLKWAFMLPSDI